MEVFARNKENNIVIARYFQKPTTNPFFIMVGQGGLFSENSEEKICEQALNFIEKKRKTATKFWKFSVWKQFCNKPSKPLFLLFKSLVYNWFLNDFEPFYGFQAFKKICS